MNGIAHTEYCYSFERTLYKLARGLDLMDNCVVRDFMALYSKLESDDRDTIIEGLELQTTRLIEDKEADIFVNCVCGICLYKFTHNCYNRQ